MVVASPWLSRNWRCVVRPVARDIPPDLVAMRDAQTLLRRAQGLLNIADQPRVASCVSSAIRETQFAIRSQARAIHSD